MQFDQIPQYLQQCPRASSQKEAVHIATAVVNVFHSSAVGSPAEHKSPGC